MKRVLRTVKALFLLDIVGGLTYSIWAFSVLTIRNCGIFLDCPASNAKFASVLAVLSRFVPDFYLYALTVSVGHGIMWMPNFLLSLSCYRDICFPEWLLVNDTPSFEAFVHLVSR
ncbi:MAG: hypothetical protein CL534_11930 [Ahrensia sp.]|nr:hypothetical protein [Ahrensia sp.]